MKSFWLVAFGCFVQLSLLAQPLQYGETRYFSFKNNFWINLHHFLYQEASGSQLRHLQEDGMTFLDIGEAPIRKGLSQEDQEILQQAISYYTKKLVAKDLRTDLGQMRTWFRKQPENGQITDTRFTREFTAILNRVAPIYRSNFWQLHESHNWEIMDQHIERIYQIEEAMIRKMEEMSANVWPAETKVRVDLTTYGSWSSAYSSSRPIMNLVISTIDPGHETSEFIETTFHEGTHLLYLFDQSPVRDEIYNQAEAREMDFPRGLWHAWLFYLCGKATQEELAAFDESHQLTIDTKNVFSNYNTPALRTILDRYYEGKLDMKEAVKTLLDDLASK
ncbi:MAG: hypothetical protein R8G66_15235 [Cytophagales bacterium]|nr:hypothetical protein [Cytophagales bacterium]